MLGKILKYEVKATGRIFLLMYVGLLALAAVNAVLTPLGAEISSGASSNFVLDQIISTLTGLALILYILAAVAVVVATMIVIVVRFYRLFGDEGYLWFTLPATANQHIIAKLIVAFVWTIVSSVVVLLSVGVLTLQAGWLDELHVIVDVWDMFVAAGYNPALWLTLILAIIVASTLFGILCFYASIAIGPNLTKSRLGGSVIAYIIIYIVTQIIGVIQVLLLMVPLTEAAQKMESMALNAEVTSGMSEVQMMNAQMSPELIDQMMWMTCGSYVVSFIVMSVVLYFITRFFMTKKLNLQ